MSIADLPGADFLSAATYRRPDFLGTDLGADISSVITCANFSCTGSSMFSTTSQRNYTELPCADMSYADLASAESRTDFTCARSPRSGLFQSVTTGAREVSWFRQVT